MLRWECGPQHPLEPSKSEGSGRTLQHGSGAVGLIRGSWCWRLAGCLVASSHERIACGLQAGREAGELRGC
eukprot:4601325-Alexandrium_andersonii.AAC.1